MRRGWSWEVVWLGWGELVGVAPKSSFMLAYTRSGNLAPRDRVPADRVQRCHVGLLSFSHLSSLMFLFALWFQVPRFQVHWGHVEYLPFPHSFSLILLLPSWHLGSRNPRHVTATTHAPKNQNKNPRGGRTAHGGLK